MDTISIPELKSNFNLFLYVIWKYLQLPKPTPVQNDIADYLMDTSKPRKIIEAFRGIGKSWITSTYVVWRLFGDPNGKYLVVSASQPRAIEFSAFTKRLLNDIPFLRYLKPTAAQRTSMLAFDVAPAIASHAPSVKSLGIFGQLTGSRATEIIADDVEVPNNSYTEDLREKLLKATNEFESILVPGGTITYLGTPQTHDSIYNKLWQTKGYDIRIWPARYPTYDEMEIYGPRLAPMILNDIIDKGDDIIGHSTDPDRFTDEDLFKREIAMGKSTFKLQFMLDTSLSDSEKYPLKLADLSVESVGNSEAPVEVTWGRNDKLRIRDLTSMGFSGDYFYSPLRLSDEWHKYLGTVLSIDPSGRGKDETAYAVVAYLHGRQFLLDIGGLQGGFEDTTLDKLASLASKYNVTKVIIESNFGDGMFTKLFQPVLLRKHQCAIEEIRSTTQKEARIIDTLEPLLNQHKLIISRTAVDNDYKTTIHSGDRFVYSLFYQLTHITKERGSLRHDDRLDALAMACRYWLDAMALDSDVSVADYRQQQLQKQLDEFTDGFNIKLNPSLGDTRDWWLSH